MLADDRITTFDWTRYNMYSCVYEPAKMTCEQLEAGRAKAYRTFYSPSRRWRFATSGAASQAPARKR